MIFGQTTGIGTYLGALLVEGWGIGCVFQPGTVYLTHDMTILSWLLTTFRSRCSAGTLPTQRSCGCDVNAKPLPNARFRHWYDNRNKFAECCYTGSSTRQHSSFSALASDDGNVASWDNSLGSRHILRQVQGFPGSVCDGNSVHGTLLPWLFWYTQCKVGRR